MRVPTVIDFFCGAGGFSEGFRQQGFKIIYGIDNWEPAISTFNHNFDLSCKQRNILDFENSTEEIEKLPNTTVIIGSPPCVSFSSSNKSGKGDKSLGVRLTEVFLKIVAIKKYCPDSILKAWFMENVSNSVYYLKDYYTFNDLNLTEWAIKYNLDPNIKAIVLNENRAIINSADYGSPQIRKRIISGEFIKIGKMILPPVLYQSQNNNQNLPSYITLRHIRKSLPRPNSKKSNKIINDPLFDDIKIKLSELTDHFYDTGLYECVWEQSKYLKTNHPYMGKMAFPENEDKPSRTITATTIGSSREAIIYKSEYNRKGDGEFRIPTIRESACLLGFPITFQFLGSEGIKSKLVGNAVCPSVSAAFAKLVRKECGLITLKKPKVILETNAIGVENLNSYQPKEFKKPPNRISGSRFRRHAFKDGNITVTLSNYDIEKNEKTVSNWVTSVQYGNGKGFPTYNYPNGFYKKIEPLIEQVRKGKFFLGIVNNGFSEKIGDSASLQKMYENQKSQNGLLKPTELISELKSIIEKLGIEEVEFDQKRKEIFSNKKIVPFKQLLALYAINKISTTANT